MLTLSAKIVEENHLTTMMITHNMKDAIKYGNRLIMMHEGHIIYDVSGEEKKEPACLRPAGQVPDRVRRRRVRQVSAAAQIDPVEERLAAMSLREKVGQLFVVRVEALDPSGQSDSTRLTWAERQGLKKYPVGGIVVFRQNVKSPEQLKKLLADFQAASGTGLLTAVDEEGGSVARLANASGFDLPNTRVPRQ